MKCARILFLFLLSTTSLTHAQKLILTEKHDKDIHAVIDNYTLAREQRDTVLLKTILTEDIDQLVSSGVWRNGVGESVQGMLRSSESNSGSRKIVIDKIRLLNSFCAIVDTRYEIQNPDGTARKMWSTFVLVHERDQWKISAIRNMLPQR